MVVQSLTFSEINKATLTLAGMAIMVRPCGMIDFVRIRLTDLYNVWIIRNGWNACQEIFYFFSL